MEDPILTTIEDIKRQACVLLIGPEIAHVADEPLGRSLRNYVRQNCTGILQDYERDGLFLFQNAKEKLKARRLVGRFYEQAAIDETIFRKIVEIPFHLVISMNPDTMLDDVAFKYGVRHRFNYFGNPEAGSLERPTQSEPLYYNLCGCKTRDDTLLLDYDDLFRQLQSTLGNPGLPDRLVEVLSTARSFLFLGFSFEKWHSQLLLRLLQRKSPDGTSNRVIGRPVPEEDTQNFLVNALNIEFLDPEVQFLDEIYNGCADAKILRKVKMLSDDAVGVMQAVQRNDLGQALDLLGLRAEADPEFMHEVTMLMSRHNQHREKVELRSLDIRDATLEYNQLIDNILKTAKEYLS